MKWQNTAGTSFFDGVARVCKQQEFVLGRIMGCKELRRPNKYIYLNIFAMAPSNTYSENVGECSVIAALGCGYGGV
jgi:hypothetical protein